MKKFFYLLAMVCTMSFFTACSSDDDPAATVWDSFSGGNFKAWGESLYVEDDDVENNIVDFDINVSKVDDTKAKVVIKTNIDGETTGTVTLPEASIQQNGTDVVISGTGNVEELDITKATANIPAKTATVKITIANNKQVSLDMTYDGKTMTATSNEKPQTAGIAGTWNMRPIVMYDGNGKVTTDPDEAVMFGGSFEMTWEVTENCPDVLGFMKAKDAAQMANGLVNQLLPNVLQSVTFTTDGKVYAVYAQASSSDDNDDETETTPTWMVAQDYATYQMVSDNKILLKLNNEKILSTVEDATAKQALGAILNEFKDGIPVNITWSNNNKSAYFFIDKDFAASLATNTVLNGLVTNLDDEALGGFGAMIKAIVQQMPELMENTTKFEAGLILDK